MMTSTENEGAQAVAPEGTPAVNPNLKWYVAHTYSGYENRAKKSLDAMLATIEDEKIRIEHQVSPVAVFGQLGPMIGLFGTVVGMILAFMTLSAGGQPKASKLAGEIAIALCATMEGLVLALPGIWFYAILKNKVQRIIFDVESTTENFLRRFYSGMKK